MSASQRIIFRFNVARFSRYPSSTSSSPASLPSRTFIFIHSRSLTFSTSLFRPPPMSQKQKRGGFREQRWQEKPSSNRIPSSSSKMEPAAAAAVEDVTSGINLLDIADKNVHSSVPLPQLQFGGIGTINKIPAHSQKVVWKQKSYGKVSGPAAVEVGNAPTNQASAEVQTNGVNKPINGQKNAALSNVFRGNLLENFTVGKSTFSQAQVRATFYPKFENEKSDQEIRTRMIEMVTRGLATVEVSLKHSGSLFMYSGHEGGAYAKNSFGNIYTAVGVFVLGRMFQEAWGPHASRKQEEFNEYLEKNHMCLSMELVTAVLGDHGQRPREDYVVVTAVAELGNGKPKFYSTPDIIAFCRKWRLPTNHVWLFSTRKSVTSFFAAFDALREEGTATSVCKALDEVADISVPGSKDHIKVQGDILEGLVARVVRCESLEHLEQVLRDFPLPPLEGAGLDLGPTLREICAANRSDEKQQIKALLNGVGTAFCPNHLDWFGTETSNSHSRTADRSVVSKFLQAHPADYSTAKLQEMVRLMRERRYRTSFKCFYDFKKFKDVSSDNLHFKMVIHVFNDSVFRQYHKEMRRKPELWPLYRGFFVDLNLFQANGETAADILKGSSQMVKGDDDNNSLADEDANLMVKLKFLTYKLRTFLIRNGLPILFKQGPMAYKTYYLRQMKIWNTSPAKQQAMSKMLDEWAVYIRRKHGNKQLSSSIYLSEAEPFLEQYAKRSPQNQALIGAAGSFVKSEDFLAITDGRDEEGDLEHEKDVPPLGHSISSKDTVMKDEGLIVFFPGIPGCAKSALCKEILNAPGGLGDDRPLQSLMGDLIKGRYWQKVADARRAKSYSVMLADKNAPNEEVWRQIEDMCRSTKSSAIPVVPDSEGTERNPFSLDALAVFIFRVLHRVNHPGNLDKSSPNAGYVLLMFYDLYDGRSREEFETDLIGRFGSLVKIPLLKSERSPLPDSVKSILEEGMKLYHLHTSRHRRLEPAKGTFAKEWAKWEKELRDVLFANADYLNSIQVPFEFAVKQVLEQLRSIATGETPAIEKRKLGTIVFAAVSLPVTEIQSLLDNLGKKDSEAGSFLKDKNLESRLQKAHVTLAHKGSHSVAALASFAPFLHQQVPVEITALLFSERVAALEACIGSINGEKIHSKNEWSHVTLWTSKGTAPVEANSLPQLLQEGKAKRVEIEPPIAITGVIQFY
ncbi:tRNA ligase 1 isoform X1 [Ipomoea triloba]|uniref:tRNA ligase 1 isoform X1 n=2 Tax=Ipomoea triloba TaxID=35885 RepID=UPI00125CD6CB|nr:tRNA ligase 1 isoform X1 [Ipomoea triloba]